MKLMDILFKQKPKEETVILPLDLEKAQIVIEKLNGMPDRILVPLGTGKYEEWRKMAKGSLCSLDTTIIMGHKVPGQYKFVGYTHSRE